MSRRSCLSISALIRFDSFASSLRQQAIMDSRVIPSGFGSPVSTEPGNTCPRFQLLPNTRYSLRSQARGLSVRLDGWMDGTGGGETSYGPRCQVVPPAESNCDSTRVFSANHGRFRQGREPGDGGASPRCSSATIQLMIKLLKQISHLIPGLYRLPLLSLGGPILYFRLSLWSNSIFRIR